jgi:hypothetical protein
LQSHSIARLGRTATTKHTGRRKCVEWFVKASIHSLARKFAILILFASLGEAAGSELPAIRLTPGNKVPACTRPAYLMKFVRDRNYRLDPKIKVPHRFAPLAKIYRRIGRCVQRVEGNCQGVRWDFAFFQMLVETNYLTFRAPDGGLGSISEDDNNFAGIGAIMDGEPGERFADLRTGVLAHLQHLLMYSGERIVAPVAQRTRAVESYVISKMASLGWPPTFTDLATLWAADHDNYADDIAGIASRFAHLYCPTKKIRQSGDR